MIAGPVEVPSIEDHIDTTARQICRVVADADADVEFVDYGTSRDHLAMGLMGRAKASYCSHYYCYGRLVLGSRTSCQ